MKFEISQELLQAVCEFLVKQPYNQVNVLLHRVQSECKPVDEKPEQKEQKDSDEVKKPA